MASGREDAVDVSHRSSGGVVGERRALAGQLVMYSFLYIPLRFVAVRLGVLLSRHDSLDSPSTLGIWVRSRRSLGVERAAHAEAARADGRCWGSSMLTLL